MLELTGSMLGEEDPHPEVFDLLHNALARLGQADAPVAAVLAYYQWRLLRRVGLLGQIDNCISCNRSLAGEGGRGLHFSSLQGGLLCAKCEVSATEKYGVDVLSLGGLRALADAEAGRGASVEEAQARAAGRVLAYHISRQLGRRLKMERHVIG